VALLCAALELVSRAPARLVPGRPKALNGSSVGIANRLECRHDFFSVLADALLRGRSLVRPGFRVKDVKMRDLLQVNCMFYSGAWVAWLYFSFRFLAFHTDALGTGYT
jgi:hypothetical protein